MGNPTYTSMNELYQAFVEHTQPETQIIHWNDQTITAAELVQNVDRYTGYLIQMGVRPGVGVGYTMPNRPEIIYLLLAISRLGGYAVPLFHMIPDMGKANIFKNCRVQWVVTTGQQLSSLREASLKIQADYKVVTIEDEFAAPVDSSLRLDDFILPKTDPNLAGLMASSSGTTGIPKMVMMNQGNLAAVVQATFELVTPVNLNGAERYSSVMAFPLSTSGMLVVLGTMFAGVNLIFSEDMSPLKYLQLMTQWRADSLSAPPSYFEALLGFPPLDSFDLTTVKRVLTGMDFFSPSLLQRLKAKFVNLSSFANGFGLIETATVFMTCKLLTEAELNQPTNRMKLVPNLGNRIEIRDENGRNIGVGEEGELYVKGPSVVPGYLGNPAETENARECASFKDGWFRTGDLARNEGNDTITLLGRRKYLIKRGGKSVSPIVVQNELNRIPGVRNSAVVGVPHQLYGEMVWAFIVKQPQVDLQLKEIMRHCRAELPNYMIPDQVTFIDEIPKNPGVGKVDFEKLKAMALQELQHINGGNNG